MSETEIISLCQQNDKKAQQDLFSRYYGEMMGVCLRYAKNKEQASDMLNSGFLKVFEQVQSYKNTDDFKLWIKNLFVQHLLQYLKSRRQEYYITTTIKVEDIKQANDLFHQVEDGDPNNLSSEQYILALQQLPPSFRSVYNMYVIDGYSHQKIAEWLEISEETSRQNLEKARFNLNRYLQTHKKDSDEQIGVQH